jgi:DNA mismatch repair protein MutL
VSRISILPDPLINKIAAGEVIERPASVVRELIDNSIDAGATRIEIEILDGGKKFMKVSDNGSGMERADALLCFERHATSKINSEDDLFNISTLGFRGEALSAIASVSKITLTTALSGSETGTRIEVIPGRKNEVKDAPPVTGTTVETEDLFYNTPARRKFLKRTQTELHHIIETVIQKAFACPSISFSLKHNRSEVLNIPVSSSLRDRFTSLYGKEFTDEFFEIKGNGPGIRLYGFSSFTGFTRSARNHQFIFINRRPVKNPTISHAVYSMYKGLIPKERHPAYFLFLDIDPQKVDVNVHPAKREVRFEKPDEIHRLVESAIYASLDSENVKAVSHTELTAMPMADRMSRAYDGKLPDQASVRESAANPFNETQTDIFSSGLTPSISRFFHLGDSFLATVTDEGLLIIDQHAAHERVLYERFLKKISIEPKPLFLPIRVELPVQEYNIVIKHRGFLNELGLNIDDFGANNVVIRALPGELHRADIKGIIMDVASGIIEEENSGIKSDLGGENLLKNIAARLACHRSVRGSEPLNDEELTRLISDLDRAEEPEKCPHGRPTKILLSLDELNKLFKRK